MKQNPLYHVFLDLLKDIFDAENQILQNLPLLMYAAANSELKESFSLHLDETKAQVQRLKKIFKFLNENPTGISCKGMHAIFEEAKSELKKNLPSSVKDVCLIIACQKVEHYEIASYGSAVSLALHLDNIDEDNRLNFVEIADLLKESLKEEMATDKKLTKIAEGGFFTKGINDKAEIESLLVHSKHKNKN